ncbi:hypothetical protein BB429_07970 [Helicobacter pylori]|uniref:hypothetical protein n=1 Tax=Helicobacter pylori TaxID=210 RepID=UPI000BEA93D2|nr:hypothetical protein [Helicobacter pylori]PDW43931.1 hypothetical protein BB429_07970 [Helicobacter pylori]
MKTMNLNEFFTHKIIYKDTPLKFKDTLEQEISQASLVEKLILANILANMVKAVPPFNTIGVSARFLTMALISFS